MLSLRFPPPFFGLDFKEDALRLAQIRKSKKRNPQLVSCGYQKLPPAVLKEGRVKKPKELASVIEKLLSSNEGEKIKTPYVAVSLPEEKSFIRTIQLPRMSKEKLPQAVVSEAEAHIPFSLEEVYLDWELTGFFVPVKPKKRLDKTLAELPHWDVLIAAVSKALTDSYVEALKLAHLQPLILEPEPLSIARALLPKGKTEKPVMILELGSQEMILIIYSRETLYFSTTLPFAAQTLTEAIKKAFGVNSERAEILKTNHGLTSSKNGRKIKKTLDSVLKELLSTIGDYLDYYERHPNHEHLPKAKLSTIILSGSGAYLKGLPQFLASRLGPEVRLGRPWINLAPSLRSLPPSAHKQALGYTTAIGLALRNVLRPDEIP